MPPEYCDQGFSMSLSMSSPARHDDQLQPQQRMQKESFVPSTQWSAQNVPVAVPPQPNVAEEYEHALVDAGAMSSLSRQQAISLLAEDLNRLSVSERNDILHEVHGIVDVVPEDDPAMVNFSLYEMQQQLDGIAHKPAYDLAYQLNYNYVSDRSFRLMFLRAHKFNAKAAAEHVVVHFSEKQELFGNELLAKDITYYDLNDQDKRALKYGRNLIFPRRDCAGRPIMGVRFPELSAEDYANGFLNNMMRASWYFVSDLARRDEQAQRLGLVCIAQNIRPCHPEAFPVIQVMGRRRRGWPINLAVTHYCGAYTPQMIESIPLLQVVLEKSVRQKFRTHFGDESFIDQELKGFGIPFQALPLACNTESVLVHRAEEVQTKILNLHQRFDGSAAWNGNSNAIFLPTIEYSQNKLTLGAESSGPARVEIEEIDMDAEGSTEQPDLMSSASEETSVHPLHAPSASSEGPATVEHPNPYCVLFGRGSSRDHPGNLRMHQIVNSRLDEYEQARKLEKTAMSATVVREVQASGGKFLKHQDGSVYWIETKDEEAREKVGKIFRRAVQLRRKARLEMGMDG